MTRYIPGSAVPIPARLAGYNTCTFAMTPGRGGFTRANVDASATYQSGYGLYLWNWFGNTPPSNTLTFNSDKTVSVTGASSGAGDLTTMGVIGSAPHFVGTAFGGGAYFEAEFLLPTPLSVNVANGWPAFWSMSGEHPIASAGGSPSNYNWPGQTAPYPFFGEVDFLEYFGTGFGGSPDGYGSARHVYWAPTGNNNYVPFNQYDNPGRASFTSYQKYGCLWVPATNSSSGYFLDYYNGVSWHSANSWTQFVGGAGQTPPPGTNGATGGGQSWAMGAIDNQHLAVILSGSSDCLMRLRSFRVFQKSAANNVTN